MLAKIVFFSAVTAATLAVILLAFVSPSPHTVPHKSLAISLYVHPPNPQNNPPLQQPTNLRASKAFIFHHKLTQGPRNTSRVIGKAQGFVLPVEHFVLAAFNIIYLTFDTPEYCGSLGIEARRTGWYGTREELVVVGGTGSFAFARGVAVFAQTTGQHSGADAMYYIKLRLRLTGHSRAIPG